MMEIKRAKEILLEVNNKISEDFRNWKGASEKRWVSQDSILEDIKLWESNGLDSIDLETLQKHVKGIKIPVYCEECGVEISQSKFLENTGLCDKCHEK